MTGEQSLIQFFKSFGVPAYEENSVPTGKNVPGYPYITFSIVLGGFGEETALDASVWTRSTSWTEANSIFKDISERIGMGGKMLRCDDGAVWLKKGSPFAQSMGDPSDNMIKRKYINLTAEFITAS